MIAIAIITIVVNLHFTSACTVTTASGTYAPISFCSGDLIFEDTFDNFDKERWKHEVTLNGGSDNHEFQWYVNSDENSFVADGNLHLQPTYTSWLYDEDFIFYGNVTIPMEECTRHTYQGCSRIGDGNDNVINPIRSAKITTWNSFAFKYGTVEIRAKNPSGDWLWPALWLSPRNTVYGPWPRSGEVDIMESRGNRNLFSRNVNVGTAMISTNLHYGPDGLHNAQLTMRANRSQSPGFNEDFHVYKLIWTPEDMQFYVDDNLVRQYEAGDGFWTHYDFPGENIWLGGTPMAPFDQEFVIQMNVAVGGTSYFNDRYTNFPSSKPYSNDSPRPAREFWEGRAQWEPTWNLYNDDRNFQIDYVRVWAL